MNIILHRPKTAEGLELLRQRAAKVHAEAVIQHISKLPCPQKQRLKLHSEIKKAYRDGR